MADAYSQAIGVALNDAKSMLGKNEVPDRAEIMQYLHGGGEDLDPHKVAWCAAFVSASLQKAGLPVPTQVVKDSAFGPGAYAPNYLTYGNAVSPKDIQAGDILVANNGSHVGFAEGPMRNGPNGPEVQLLAGNQRDPSGQYTPGSYTNPTTGAVANRSQVGMVGEQWVPLSQYSARRYQPSDNSASSTASSPATSGAAPKPAQDTNAIIDILSRNISGIETGGAANPYGIIQSRTGAVGKYQVMPFNVGPWTKQALGQEMTPDQFRASPSAQEAVFRDQASRALATMSPQDFASTWFTGKPYSQATAGKSDYTGTTNANYVARATQGIDAAGNVAGTPSTPATQGTSLTSVPAAAGASGGILPGFGTKEASDQFLAGLKQAGILPQTGDQGGQQQDIKPSPIMSGPGLRNSPGLAGIGEAASKLEPQLTHYSPGLYGQSLNSQPLAWGSSPIPAPSWLTAGQQQQPAAQGYGTNLNSLQMAGGLSPYQLQMMMNPMMLDQGGGNG